MQPERTEVTAFSVAGIQTRTTNTQEFNPLSAKIPGLWARFMTEEVYGKVPHVTDATAVYGVYADFASDANGAYTLTAGRAVQQATLPESAYQTVQIQAGTYLLFTATGARPQVVITTWMAIWQYFQQHPEIQRRYVSDFERYDGTDGIAIYIGIRG